MEDQRKPKFTLTSIVQKICMAEVDKKHDKKLENNQKYKKGD